MSKHPLSYYANIVVLLLLAVVRAEEGESSSALHTPRTELASVMNELHSITTTADASFATLQAPKLGLVACESNESDKNPYCDEAGTCVTIVEGRRFCLCKPGFVRESATCDTLDRIQALLTAGDLQRNDALHLNQKEGNYVEVLDSSVVSHDRTLQDIPSPAIPTTAAPSTTPYPTLMSIVPTGSWYPTQTSRPTATWYPSHTWRPSVTWYPTVTRRPSTVPSSPPSDTTSADAGHTPSIEPSISAFPTEVDDAPPTAAGAPSNEEPGPGLPPAAPTPAAEESSETSPKSSPSSAPSGGAIFGLVAAVVAVVVLVYVVWSRQSGTGQRRHRREQLRNDLELTESRASYRDRVGTYDPNEII